MKGVTGQALGVDANQRGTLRKVTKVKNSVFLAVGWISERTDSKISKFGGQCCVSSGCLICVVFL